MKFILYMVMLMIVLLPTQGISLFKHFCGGKLISFEVYEKHEKPCCDDHDDPCGGCEDQETIWALDDFQISKTTITLLFPVTVSDIETLDISSFPKITLDHIPFTPFNDPPGWSGRQLSILYQSFLL